MKTIQRELSLFICLMLLSLGAQAQTYKDDEHDDDEEKARQEFILQGQPNIFTILKPGKSPAELAQIQGNRVNIQQVGDFNQAAIITRTENSEINLLQEGNYNRTGLFYKARTAFADLQQFGDHNTIRDAAFNPQRDISLELTQEGDGLYFERFGVNNLTKSLKFRQTEASPTIIVRSFN